MEKAAVMTLKTEDLDDHTRFRQLFSISYSDLIGFIFTYLKKFSSFILLFWIICLLFLNLAVLIRICSASQFPFTNVILHSFLGFIVLPIICIPIHEGLHIIPYYLSGARNIRIGMDLKQFLFYVTAHRHVASPVQFIMVAMVPFVSISILVIIMIILLPGLWKWSLSVFLFAHATMCAGDFALLNFYFINRDKKIYTWDDADEKMAYFYEKIVKNEGEPG